MTIASRIRWRRRFALMTPRLSWGQSSSVAVPVQHHVILVWFGCVVQVAFARPDGVL